MIRCCTFHQIRQERLQIVTSLLSQWVKSLQSIFSHNMPAASSTLLILLKPCHETAPLPRSLFRHKKKETSLLAFPIQLVLFYCCLLAELADMEAILWPGTWERGWRGSLYHHGSRHEEMALREPLRRTHACCNGSRCSCLSGIPTVVLNITRVVELNMGRCKRMFYVCVCEACQNSCVWKLCKGQ